MSDNQQIYDAITATTDAHEQEHNVQIPLVILLEHSLAAAVKKLVATPAPSPAGAATLSERENLTPLTVQTDGSAKGNPAESPAQSISPDAAATARLAASDIEEQLYGLVDGYMKEEPVNLREVMERDAHAILLRHFGPIYQRLANAERKVLELTNRSG